MSKLIAQYNKVSGPNAIGEYVLSFAIQREHLDLLLDVVGQLEKKSQVILDITPITETSKAQKVLDDSKIGNRTKRIRKIHAGFDELAIKFKVPASDMKERIKKKLKVESIEKATDDELLKIIDYIEKIITPLPDEPNKS